MGPNEAANDRAGRAVDEYATQLLSINKLSMYNVWVQNKRQTRDWCGCTSTVASEANLPEAQWVLGVNCRRVSEVVLKAATVRPEVMSSFNSGETDEIELES